jgi:hypothetical protein
VQIVPPEDALERFVIELAQVMDVIRDLREAQKDDSDQVAIQELDQILLKVTKAIANWYSPIREYSIECANLKEDFDHLATITPAIEAKIRFEKCMGSFGRELGAPITMLIGSWELMCQMPHKQDLRKTLSDHVDNIIIRIFEFIELIKSYQRGQFIP